MLLPFKAAIPKPDIQADQEIPPNAKLADIWVTHRDDLLLPLYPEMEDLRRYAWDQPLGDMSIEYMGALKGHVLTHLGDRLNAAFRHRLLHDLGCRIAKHPSQGRNVVMDGTDTCFISDAYDALSNGKGLEKLPHRIRALAEEFRARCGLQGASRVANVKLTPSTFKLHIELSREAEARECRGWSACPIAEHSRTFAYVDEKIAGAFATSLGGRIGGVSVDKRPAGLSVLQWMFGVHEQAWEAANRHARRKHRKARRRGKGGRRGRKQKACSGFGRWCPCASRKDVRVSSLATDGVALCAFLKIPAKSTPSSTPPPPLEERIKQFVSEVEGSPVYMMAEDPGRVNISQVMVKGAPLHPLPPAAAACSDKQVRLTRASNRRRTLQSLREKEELRRRRGNPMLRHAHDTLGAGGCTWKTTDSSRFLEMVRRLVSVQSTLVNEYVRGTWYASWKMLLWRRKRMVLAQHYSNLIRTHVPKGAAVILGRGNAGFSSTGKGETSVPTSRVGLEQFRALRALRTRNPSLQVPLCEDRTTMTCHHCGNVLQNVIGDNETVLRGLKECRECYPGDRKLQHWCRLERQRFEEKTELQHLAAWPRPREVVVTRKVVEADEVMRRKILGDDGYPMSKLESCVVRERTEGYTSRLLNRDINATKNLMQVLEALVLGRSRPAHLVKKRRERAQPLPPAAEMEEGVIQDA